MSGSPKEPPPLPTGLRIRRGKIHYRFRVAGVTYTGSTGFAATARNATAALKVLAEERRKVEQGELLSRLVPRRFSDAMTQYLDWKRGEHPDHPATAMRVAVSATSLVTFFGVTMVHAIASGHVEDFKDWRRRQGIREITLRHDLHALAGFVSYAKRQGWLRRTPLEGVRIPSDAGAMREHVVTEVEEAAYFTAGAANLLLHDAARLILLTGMRPSEVLALRRDDINWDQNAVQMRAGKTRAARRTIYPRREAVELLLVRSAVAKAMERSELFIGARGCRKPQLNPLHWRVLDATGLSFTLYELRHTFASRMAARGCPLPTLAAILGHSSLRTVSRYVHPSAADQRSAMATYGGEPPAAGKDGRAQR